MLAEPDLHPTTARLFAVPLLPEKTVPTVPASMSGGLAAGAERNSASNSEAVLGAVVGDGEVDLFDATALEVDAYPATVKDVVALHAVGDSGEHVVTVTNRAVLPLHARPRLTKRDVPDSAPRDE